MLVYNREIKEKIKYKDKVINSFVDSNDSNIDWKTVESFGEEWSKFSKFTDSEIQKAGNEYFDIVDESILNSNSLVLDIGCGSGRWSKYIANKAKFVEAIDPSNAVFSAIRLLKNDNVRVSKASVENIPFADESFDFAFSLGVLHHIPNTPLALKESVKKVKKGGYFLVYLYYSLDNRGSLYKLLFHLSNSIRFIISKLPNAIKRIVCDIIAVLVYFPFAKFSAILKVIKLKKIAKRMPLFNYHDKTFRLMRNDSLDRFGTPLEQRFSKIEINKMMEEAGLINIVFSEKEPFWHAVGQKK